MAPARYVEDFICRHKLPASFEQIIDEHYNALVPWLVQRRRSNRPLFLGINGAQGTGKSTLADFLKVALEEDESWHVAVLSIDDFYLTRAERENLGQTVHQLLATRGVPGTHDLQLLSNCIDQLSKLDASKSLILPRFDKALDDRAVIDTWRVIMGPVDLIILEGWCVGSASQDSGILSEPINQLERDSDPDGTWRHFVNRQLETGYARLFAELDFLFFLQAPNFQAIFRWRLEQEKKLAATSTQGSIGIMDDAQIANFLQHYERLTRANLESLPRIADIILELDDNHNCVRRIHSSLK